MKLDAVKQFVQLRAQLAQEEARLEERLKNINRALGGEIPALAPTKEGRPTKRGAKRIKNPMSLKAAVIKVTTGKPLSKAEILAAVQKLGWQTTSQTPMRLVDGVLYGKNPKFKNQGGKFSPA